MSPLQAAKEHCPNYQPDGSCLGIYYNDAMKDPCETFGSGELCTWRYGAGVCRFQTTSPQTARKLSQRRGAMLVAWSVNKGYVRVFEEQIEPWRARRLVRR